MDSKSTRIGLRFCLAVFLAASISCQTEPEPGFDSLSTFPSNSEKVSIREVKLIPVQEIPAEYRSIRANALESELDLPADVIVQKGVRAYPFASRTLDEVRFVPMDPLLSGFRLINPDDVESINADKLRTPFVGTGVAVGDVDGDELPDIVAASRTNGIRVFKNLGGMVFNDVTNRVAVELRSFWGTTPTLVDINEDGLLDIYLCGYDVPNRLFINKGRKFKDESQRFGLDFRGASVCASFIDFDRDGDLDMFLVTNRLPPKIQVDQLPIDDAPGQPPQIKAEFLEQNHLIGHPDGTYKPVESGQFDHLFRNDGYRFIDVTEESGIGNHPYHGMASLWCDFNNDGWPDLYVANDHKDPDQLFINNGPNDQGTVKFSSLAAKSMPHFPWFSKGLDCGDLNNDGFLELLTTGSAQADHFSMFTGTGNLYGPRGDAWFQSWSKPPQQFANAVFLNSGNNRFSDIAPIAKLDATDWTWSVRAADFDNDGLLDLIYSNGRVRDFLNNDLNREMQHSDGPSKYWLDKARLPLPDRVFRNLGDLQFEDMTEGWGLGSNRLSQSLATGDLDNDGDLDFVSTGFGEELQVFRNDVNRNNAIKIRLVGIQSNTLGTGARVVLQAVEGGQEQTQFVNPSRGFMSCSDPVIQFGVGDTKIIHRLEIHWPSGGVQKLFALRSNYLYRIEEIQSSGFISRTAKATARTTKFQRETTSINKDRMSELDFDDFDKQPLVPFQNSRLGPGISWADVDGDGDHDLFRGGAAFDPGVVFLNQGRLKFTDTKQACFKNHSRSEDLGSVFFDADGDHDLDLYVVSGGIESRDGDNTLQDRLYLNNGQGEFSISENLLPDMGFSGATVSAVDFDNDQRVDLFVGGRVQPGIYPLAPRSVLLRNTENGFADVTDEVAPGLANVGMVASSAWADVNNDQQPDLLLAIQWGPIKCFQNQDGKLIDVSESAGLSSRTGLYNSINCGDIDNDGDLDFVVGNLGLNTPYRASPEDPIHIYHGDLGSKQNRIIEAYSQNGVVYPRRGLELWQLHLPEFAKPFSSSAAFAQATLAEIVPAKELSSAYHREVNSLESGLLVNESSADGIRFSFRPLDRLAQTSPIFGSQLVDIDGDGNLDLYVLQNNSNVFAETVPMNSGVSQLLLGSGDGEFTPVSDWQSGLDVVADGRSLTVTDVNGDARADFVAATNDDGIHVFSGRSRHDAFVIDLPKISENRNYIGAAVRLTLSDGSEQLHQITAGAGYLSQSPAIVFAGRQAVKNIAVRWPDGTTKTGPVEDFISR